MDKKLEFARILSSNIDEEDNDVNKESELDLIDSLIKDIDLKKNYNSRYNFYINFIKMYNKNPKIIRYIYTKLNAIKNLHETEKDLIGKLNFAETKTGGYKKKVQNNSLPILNEKIIELINKVKNGKQKNIQLKNSLHKKIKDLIINTFGNSIIEESVEDVVKKILKGGDPATSTNSTKLTENNIKSATENNIKSAINSLLSTINKESINDNIIYDKLSDNKFKELIYDIKNSLEEKYNTEKDIQNELSKSVLPMINDIDLIFKNTQPQGAQPQGAQTQGAQPQGAQPQVLQPQVLQPQGAQPQQYVSSSYSSSYNNKPSSNTTTPITEIINSIDTRDNENDSFRKVVKVLQKHYGLKNLINFNNKNYKDSDDKKNNKYDNIILQLNYDIDTFNDKEDYDQSSIKNIKNKIISFENNPSNPYKHIPLSFEDRLVFIFTTFFIRYIALILIQWSIDINIIRSFEEGFIYYAVLYISIFWFFVLFINIDNTFKVDYMNISNALNSIRSLFYYFYMGTNGITRLLVHSAIICVLIVVPVILNIKKYNNYTDEDEGKKEKLISYEERKKLNKSLSLFTIYLWILTSIIATKF